MTAPYFAPRLLTGRVAGRIVEAWIGRTSLESESLPRYDDPEATGSVTGVPEQQDGQEKKGPGRWGTYLPSSEQRRCHSVEVSASIDTSGSGE